MNEKNKTDDNLKLSEVLRETQSKLKTAGIEGSRREAQMLLCYVFKIDPIQLISNGMMYVDQEKKDQLHLLIMRRLDGEPIGRIFGRKEIFGLNFSYSKGTLEPRDDTETLIETVLGDARRNFNDNLSILELGTGSGVIAISLLVNLPNAVAFATDISSVPLGNAQENAVTHEVTDRLHLVKTNWCSGIDGKFDIIVSNPPYIRSAAIRDLQREVVEHDPMLALDGGADGLDAYREIFIQCSRLTKGGTKLYVEIGFDQGKSICVLADEYSWQSERVVEDMSGNVRVAVFVRTDQDAIAAT